MPTAAARSSTTPGQKLHPLPGPHVGGNYAFAIDRFAELLEWAEIIDGALFPNAAMAVELKEPALLLMTWVENNRDRQLAERFIEDLVSRPLAAIAADPYVAGALEPLLTRHHKT